MGVGVRLPVEETPVSSLELLSCRAMSTDVVAPAEVAQGSATAAACCGCCGARAAAVVAWPKTLATGGGRSRGAEPAQAAGAGAATPVLRERRGWYQGSVASPSSSTCPSARPPDREKEREIAGEMAGCDARHGSHATRPRDAGPLTTIHQPTCLSIHLSTYPPIHLSTYPPIHLSTYLSEAACSEAACPAALPGGLRGGRQPLARPARPARPCLARVGLLALQPHPAVADGPVTGEAHTCERTPAWEPAC